MINAEEMNMNQNREDFKRGTAELLILHLLTGADLYGYQIAQAFDEKSNGEYTMLEGSLYPILYKLEDAGLISSYIVKAGVRRTRKMYHLEAPGKTHYETILREYLNVTNNIFRILDLPEPAPQARIQAQKKGPDPSAQSS